MKMQDTRIDKEVFGETPNGEIVYKYTLRNADGMEVDIITYGGIISRCTSRDRKGKYHNIVLNFDNLDSYLQGNAFLGALIGRFGNRIAKGKFTLDNIDYQVSRNEGKNHLHGGEKGFDKVVWNAATRIRMDCASLVLTYTSDHLEEGYPGKLDIAVTYTLSDDNELSVQYEAISDRPTIINPTQHSYFNLSGDFTKEILDHELLLNADSYLPVDSDMIPLGGTRSVAGTPFDFRKTKVIGESIFKKDEQLNIGKGFDHCWVLNSNGESMKLAASLYHWRTGRLLEVFTTAPAVQFYSGNVLSGYCSHKKKTIYEKRQGLCLETQHYPDSPNQPDFPSVRLDPGDNYSSRTVFKFSNA
ncbi:MAG: galactose mutarotase [Flavobacteriaceae bacterium]|nr:galactose mutarotase [Flavobacteriaceae bacterium]